LKSFEHLLSTAAENIQTTSPSSPIVMLRSKVTRLKAVSVVEEEIIVIAETSVEDPTEATTKDVKVVSTTIQIRLRKTGDATTTISQTT
jgi:hypothetical protein